MSQSKRLKVLVIIATSFCLFFTISFMASCTETAPAEEVQSGNKVLEEEAKEEVEPAPEALSMAPR